ncbi:MAG: hypothetical protein IKX75_05205 [Desulfovibrio sp.]|nr:hypothetical protein [Desulfovibrio sp.]
MIQAEPGFLDGACDMHVHFAPDVVPRAMTAPALALGCRDAGMRAVLLKNHYAPTVLCARAVAEMVPGMRVFGGLVLNASVGGINPAAVEAALRMGAKEIWMPTVSAGRRQRRVPDGHLAPRVAVFDAAGLPVPGLEAVLEMIARADAILGTGHLAPQETLALAALARNAGVSKILVTHPEFDAIAMDLATQAALADQGAFFERCYHTLHGAAPGRTKAMADAIRYLGPESTVLASDAGQLGGASPAHALLRFCEELLRYGIAADQIAMMLKDNPAWLLGLAR